MNEEKNVAYYMTKSLLELLQKKKFADISITELVNHAGIGRKSFYRNFNSKEEILTKHIDSITSNFLKNSQITFHKDDLKTTIILILNHMKEYDSFIKLLYKNNLIHLIEDNFRDTIVKLTEDHSLQYSYFMTGVYYNIYYYWFITDYKDTPEELATAIINDLKAKIKD